MYLMDLGVNMTDDVCVDGLMSAIRWVGCYGTNSASTSRNRWSRRAPAYAIPQASRRGILH